MLLNESALLSPPQHFKQSEHQLNAQVTAKCAD